jgi:sugar/nucleoside kinase (ribokinase family)
VKVVNAVGAGDALVAGLAVGLVRGWPLPEVLRYAQAVAAASLAHWEAGKVTPEDVAALLPQVSLGKF